MILKLNNKVLFNAILLICFFVFYVILMLVNDCKTSNISLIMKIQFGLIGMMSFYSILEDVRPYSLNKMHWYFILVFMFFVPISHLYDDYWPWEYRLNINTMEFSNCLIILWCIIYYLFYKPWFRQYSVDENNCLNFSQYECMFLVCASIIAVTSLIKMIGFNNLFIRDAAMRYNSILEYVLLYFFRAVPVISTAILLRCNPSSTIYRFCAIFLCFTLSLMVNFPVALSRYWSAVVYLGLLISMLPLRIWSFRSFDIMIFVSIIIVFPIMKLFKWYSLNEVINMNIDFSYAALFYGGDFDAYSMLCRIVEYVDVFGFTLGEQIRSVVLFFIPRVIWNIKGAPTGELVSSSQGASYTNLSAPLMGEGYIDFGIIGVVVYAILFSTLLSILDFKYWSNRNNLITSYIEFMVPFLMGFVVFLMRGAFQPIIIRIMGFFLFLMMICLIKNFKVFYRRIFIKSIS